MFPSIGLRDMANWTLSGYRATGRPTGALYALVVKLSLACGKLFPAWKKVNWSFCLGKPVRSRHSVPAAGNGYLLPGHVQAIPGALLGCSPAARLSCKQVPEPALTRTTRRDVVTKLRDNHRLAPCPTEVVACLPSGKLKSPGGVYGPFIRREKGSARGDFQGENRGLMVQDVPSARSRSGGFLTEGSPKGRIGMGHIHHPNS